MSGTVNISRDIWHDTAFKPEPFTEREAFMWLIMEASYKPREKRIGNVTVELQRGQLASSVRFMCEAWGWSKSRVDRFLKRLENRDTIGTQSGTGINVITVCKYDDYQNKPKDSGTVEGEKRDSSGTAAGQQRDKPNKGLIPDAKSEQEKPKVSKDSEAIEILAATVPQQLAEEFAAHRRDLKKPITKRAAAAMSSQLTNHPDPSAVLIASIANGWQGIFPEKIKSNGGRYDNRNHSTKHQAHNSGGVSRNDPTLERIARLAGLSEAQGHGGA